MTFARDLYVIEVDEIDEVGDWMAVSEDKKNVKMGGGDAYRDESVARAFVSFAPPRRRRRENPFLFIQLTL